MNWPTGIKIIDDLEKEGKPVLLSFSCGKDAIAAWLKLRGRVEVIPFFLYLVPGLEFVEESVRYYEEFFDQKIIRLPNPNLYRMINSAIYQPPDRLTTIDGCGLPNFSHDDLRDELVSDLGLSADSWTVDGVRAADSLNRHTAMKMYGPLNHKRKVAHAVWDMKKPELIDIIERSGVKLPVDYQMFGRTFDGIDFRFIAPIKKHFPKDYETILEWFPLIELEMMRYEKTA